MENFPLCCGRRVIAETDRKPLETIFKKPLNEAPPRLQRMLLKLTKYDLHRRYVPGRKQVLSDCLSRAPLQDTEPGSAPEDVVGVNLIEELGFETTTLQRFRDYSAADETSQVVMSPKVGLLRRTRWMGLQTNTGVTEKSSV